MATSKYNKSEALKESWKRDYQNDIKVLKFPTPNKEGGK